MFLQRNTAGQVFTIPGTLRNIADGSAVTTGATLTWIKDGTSGASAGTLTHVSDGAYTYAPTQAETDAKICGWVLTKAAAAGISGSIRTTNADPNDGMRLGLTALPNANAGSNGGLPELDANGNLPANVNRILNVAPTLDGNNVLNVAVKDWNGAVVGNLPTNFNLLTINADGSITLSAKESRVIRNGTAQAGAASTITLDSGASATDSFYNGCQIKIDSATGAGQVRTVIGYVGATKVATVDRAWATNPDAASVFTVVSLAGPKLDTNLAVTAGTVSDKSGYSLTQSFPVNFASMAISGGGAVTVGTNNDKTGYSLTQAFPTNFASMAISAGGAVTVGTNNDKSGYALTQAFPTNFSSLSITAGGGVTAGTVSDKTGYSLTSGEHTNIAGDVLNATASSYNSAGSIGAKINAAGSASDPLANAVPGSYAAGTAGYVLGHNLDAAISSRSAPGAQMDLVNAPNATAVTALANGLLDLANAIDPAGGADSLRKALRLILAACAGQLSGAGTTSNVIKDTTAAKNRISATVDSQGNRSAVVYDLT